jgi:hypothetical protein
MLEGKMTGGRGRREADTQTGLQRVHEHEDDPSVDGGSTRAEIGRIPDPSKIPDDSTRWDRRNPRSE